MGVFVGMALTWQFGEALMGFGAQERRRLGGRARAGARAAYPRADGADDRRQDRDGHHRRARIDEGLGADRRHPSLGADPIKKSWCGRAYVASTRHAAAAQHLRQRARADRRRLHRRPRVRLRPSTSARRTSTSRTRWTASRGSVKSFTFGLLVGLIGCYQGFQTRFGTEAVGISTTNTVVAHQRGDHRVRLRADDDLPPGRIVRHGADHRAP